jgi:c-di-GMP-binding flagellar brake protein YcgR
MSAEMKRPKEFEAIEDPREVLRYLVDGAKTLAQTTLWTENQESLLQTHITSFSQGDRSLYIWLPTEAENSPVLNSLAKKGTDEVFFSVYLSTANLFFKTRLLDVGKSELKFLAPEKVFKVQRRANVRFQIPDGHVLRVEFPDILLPEVLQRKKVVDISAGGLSFLTSPEEAPIYQKGVIVRDLKLVLHLQTLTFDAEVRHFKPVETFKEKSIRVGISFKNILPEDVAAIAQFVLEESRKYFARFI